MEIYDKKTPEGTRDYLFEECKIRRQIENRLKKLFLSRGFSEVVTPALEYYDVYTRHSCAMGQESMYKLIDQKGRILVLRPDSTGPIARVAATRLKDHQPPIRLFYNQPVFSVNPKLSGRDDIVTQIGVELLGADTKKSDYEMLHMSCESLEAACGSNPFHLELGHTGVFQFLIGNLSASDEVKEQIRTLVENKNFAALSDLLDTLEQNDITKTLRLFPRFFGGEEVLAMAESCLDATEYRIMLSELREAFSMLKSFGFAQQGMIDLGLVNRIDYYTGLVFQGYMEGSGDVILSGGRYDNLVGEFGRELPAIGFGINIDYLVSALFRQNRPDAYAGQCETVLVYCEAEDTVHALRHLSRLHQQGQAAEFYCMDGLEGARAYAANHDFCRIDLVCENGVEVLVCREKGERR